MRANCTLEICLILKLKSSNFQYKVKIIHYFPFKAKIIHFFQFKTKIIHFFQFKTKIIHFFRLKLKLSNFFRQKLKLSIIFSCSILESDGVKSANKRNWFRVFSKKRIILEDQFSVLFEILSDLFSFFQKKCLSLLYLDPFWFFKCKTTKH